MASDDLFTRDEVLGGLPARRAATVLFLVESRAAYLTDQARRAADFLAPEDVSRERDLAFIEAWSLGREPPIAPSIRDLEQYSARWADLVPANPSIRAAVAHLLGQKYGFTRASVPGIRAALGLDTDAVTRAYQRQYGVAVDTVYVARASAMDWLPWAWTRLSARVDSLSPFWLTFALTVAFGLSQAFLALPTAVARVGAVPGVVFVVGIGLINVLTMACMAESCARSGDFRYGRAFLGRLVTNFLGAEASALFSATTAIRSFLVLLAGSLGLGITLSAFTGIPAEAWVVGLLFVELYYLSRKSSSVTVTTMLSLVSLNLLCVSLISILAFTRLQPGNLLEMHVPLVSGTPLETGSLRLVFGVVLMLYIGHVYAVQCAKIVLPRDPSARALIRGSVAGSAILTGIFAMWVLAVNGAVDAGALAREAGTALAPLAERIGRAVHPLGSLLVVLLLGMSCLRTSTVLFNLTQEWVPARLRSIVTLPRRRASLFFEPRGTARRGPQLGVTYLGLSGGRARLRIDVAWHGAVERSDVDVSGTWDAASLLDRFPGRPAPGVGLVLEPLGAHAEAVSLRVTTTLSARFVGEWGGGDVRPGDHLALDDSRRALVNWMTRRGDVSFEEILSHRGGDPGEVRALLDELAAQGVVRPPDGPAGRYRARLVTRPSRAVPDEIWRALDDPAVPNAAPRSERGGRLALRLRETMLGERARFLTSAAPVLLVFLIAQWLLFTRSASFAGVLGFGGVIANSLTAGIFPVLLLFASRRKGDYVPVVAYRLLGHPAFTIGVCLLAFGNLLVHGLFIYRDPWSRGTALVFALAAAGIIGETLRHGVFARRVVVELREDTRPDASGVLTVTSAGRPLTAGVRLGYAAGDETADAARVDVRHAARLRTVALRLPAGTARELKVWTHRVTPEGASEPLPALVEVREAGQTRRFDSRLCGGQAVFPVSGDECWIEMELRRDEPSAPVADLGGGLDRGVTGAPSRPRPRRP